MDPIIQQSNHENNGKNGTIIASITHSSEEVVDSMISEINVDVPSTKPIL